MPRGYYGRAAQALAQASVPAPIATGPIPAPQHAVVVGAGEGFIGGSDSSATGGGWKTAVVAAAAVTGIVMLGAVTTSFQGRRQKRRTASSPFRSMY